LIDFVVFCPVRVFNEGGSLCDASRRRLGFFEKLSRRRRREKNISSRRRRRRGKARLAADG